MNQNSHHFDSVEDPVSIGRAVDLLQVEYPDINPSTLRFLESEGLLSPARTPGGHRLYRAEDLERFRSIRMMQRHRLPIDEIRERLSRLDKLGGPEDLSDEWFERVIGGDLPGAAQLIRDADRLGMPLSTTYVDVIGRAMRRVGLGWESGEILVGQEKEATELAKDLVAELSARHAAPITREQVILAAGVEGDHHDLGLRMVAGLLREQGYLVHLLGADVAVSFLIESIRLRRPDVVLLGATLSERMPMLIETIGELRRHFTGADEPQIIVGGPVVVEHFDELERLDVIPVATMGVRAAARAILFTTGTMPTGESSR